MLLLDEPTNHLDAESVAWLEASAGSIQGTVVAVTHDRYFLDNVAGWILELDRGKGIPWEGNYSSWLDQKKKRLDRGEAGRPRAGSMRELEWVRTTPRAGRPRARRVWPPTRRLAEQEHRSATRPPRSFIPPGPRLGDVVIEAKNLARRTATGC